VGLEPWRGSTSRGRSTPRLPQGLLGIGYATSRGRLLRDDDPSSGDESSGSDLRGRHPDEQRHRHGGGRHRGAGRAAVGVGLSVVNAVSEMRWELKRRVDVLDENGNTTTTHYPGRENVVSHLPRSWVANAAWQREGSFSPGRAAGRRRAGLARRVEKRLGLLALRSGSPGKRTTGCKGRWEPALDAASLSTCRSAPILGFIAKAGAPARASVGVPF